MQCHITRQNTSIHDAVKQRLARSKMQGELYKVVSEIAFEVRSLGSVSLASLLRRGEPFSYDEVVQDVASELKIKYSKTDTTSSIEEKVLEVLVEKLENRLSVTDKQLLRLLLLVAHWRLASC